MFNIKTRLRLFLSTVLGRDFLHISTQLIKSSDIISFDIFDTLVFRNIPMPIDAFGLINDDRFQRLRIEAEKKAKEKSCFEDITIDDIYKYLPGYESSVEIEKEIEICRANPDAFVFFNKVKSGEYGYKKIIIVSDMYLTSSVIFSILIHCGYDLKDVKIYVSGEQGITKRSGNLFMKVIEESGTNNILHIGDNLISDYIMPRRVGLRSFLYKGEMNRLLK